MPTREELQTKARADLLLRAGNRAEALGLYRSLLGRVAALEPGLYETWLDGALAAYRSLGSKRAAGFIQLSLRRFSEVQSTLDPNVDPVPWATAAARLGKVKEAAALLESKGFLVLAARELHAADDHAGALRLWERLSRAPTLRGHAYESALVHLMRARAQQSLGNADASAAHLNEAIGGLEGLADEYESGGQRERAFDCYLLMLQIGQGEGSAFENLAEGYANAIRILIADGQRDFALQYLDDFMAAAAERKEFHAAATVACDAADYCRRLGLGFESVFLKRATELWSLAAEQSRAQGHAPDLAENALAAALDAATSLGDLGLVSNVYAALAALPINTERAARYATLSQRHARSTDVATLQGPKTALPSVFKSRGAYQDIASQDLIEWELGGDVEATLALIVVERTDHQRFARAALVALLLTADDPQWITNAGAARAVAQGLGDVETYEVLAPLERLALHDAVDVRCAVMGAAGKVLCKRSFKTIRQGLQDQDERVRVEARRALKGLHFRDGLETLLSIFRESAEPSVRQAALSAIADVPTLEAALVLLDVIRLDDSPLRAFAVERLSTFPSSGLVPHVKASLELASPGARAGLQLVLAALEAYRI